MLTQFDTQLFYSMVNDPISALMTTERYASSSCWVSYRGRSSLLKHVCARGYSESWKRRGEGKNQGRGGGGQVSTGEGRERERGERGEERR